MMRLLLLFILLSTLEAYEYQKFKLGFFTSVHVLTIDPKEESIHLVASDERTPLPELAKKNKANAAINGGYFQENGRPSFILKIDGKLLETRMHKGAVLAFNDGGKEPFIGALNTRVYKKKNILGGIPLLVRDGKILVTYPEVLTYNPFLYARHPRTAIGIREDGKWMFVVVDGRVWGYFGGMTIPELATYMAEMGAVDAINLDGGGSSIMYVEGAVVSAPADGEKDLGRPVKDVLIVR